MKFSENALYILGSKYLRKDIETDFVLETPEEMFERIACGLAKVEEKYCKTKKQIENYKNSFLEIMLKKEFIPAGRTISGIGNVDVKKVVSNCVVLEIKDSLDDIFQTLKDAALLQQSGSGIGFAFNNLRPAGSITKTSQGTSSGPVSFIHVYDTCFGVVKQMERNGANMAVMRIDHPDILEFIMCKDIEGDLKNFNISIGITNKFMFEMIEGYKMKKEERKTWMCNFNEKIYKPRIIKRDQNFNLIEIEDVDYSAVDIWEMFIKQARKNGEPGVIFLDTVNDTNPLPGLGKLECCNPYLSFFIFFFVLFFNKIVGVQNKCYMLMMHVIWDQ